MTGLPSLLPTLLGYGVGFTAPSDTEPWDVLLGGYRFMLAASVDNPFIRRGAPYRSDQINFSGEPGETALGFWWQRSQSTWHLGTGSPTFDGPGSGTPDIASARYADSYGIDPWTPGEISLLHDTANIQTVISVPVGPVAADNAAGATFVYWSDQDRFYQWSETGGVVVATGAWTTITSMCSNGVSVYCSDNAQIIGFTPSGTFQYYTGLTGTRFCLRWAKQRLMFAQDASIYELSIAGPTAALPAPLFTHPNPSWVWTDIVAGPGAIYASGYAGSTSAVYKFVLSTSGALPVLTAGITACELPDGEQALCLLTYLQLFIAIGTSRGLRVCSFSDTDIALAPLTIENVGPVRDVMGWDRFLYTTCDDAGQGFAGLARVDLSSEVATSRYAWAPDVRANDDVAGFGGVTGTVLGLVMWQDAANDPTPVFSVTGAGLYARHYQRLAQSGSLTSGRILFGMSDLKIFQRMSITTGGQGTVTFSTGTDSDTGDVARATIDTGARDRIEVDIGSTRGSTLTVGLALTRSSLFVGPKVLSWSAKALPSQPREEQFLVPLRCYDHVENGFGETSYDSAIEISDGIADLVRTQEPTTFQTFFGKSVDDWRTWVVQIEDHEFRQVTCDGGWGGLLTVSLRTVIGE